MRFKYIEDIDSWLECKKKERERKALLCFFSRTYKIKNFIFFEYRNRKDSNSRRTTLSRSRDITFESRSTHVFLGWDTVHRVVPSPQESSWSSSRHAWTCWWRTGPHSSCLPLVGNSSRIFCLEINDTVLELNMF